MDANPRPPGRALRVSSATLSRCKSVERRWRGDEITAFYALIGAILHEHSVENIGDRGDSRRKTGD
jgi:hypothetical protein